MAHKGRCFCGAVEVEVEGAPEAMGYCHCQSCRSWSAGPVNAFSLWKPDAVKVTKGQDQIATFAKSPGSEREYCKTCGGHIMTNHPPLESGRRVRRHDPDPQLPASGACQLPGVGAAD